MTSKAPLATPTRKPKKNLSSIILIGVSCLVLLLQPLPSANGQLLESIGAGIEFVIHTIEGIQQTWEVVEATDVLKNKGPANNPNIKDLVSKKHHELMDRVVEIYRAIENIEYETINTASWTIESINKHVVGSLSLELRLNELGEYISRISAEELNMRDYAENFDKLDPITIRRFAEWTISPHSTAIQGLLDRIHAIVIGSADLDNIGKKSLLAQLATYLQDSSEHVCSTQRSGQQVLHQMYTAVALTELKGYAMMQFSWMILRTYGVGNFTKEADLMRQRFESRTNKTHVVLQRVMERADNCLWRCDAPENEEGRTYERVTKLLQGYIENEVDLNNEETCRETCDHYQYTESFTCFKELYCSKQPKCTGKVLYCQYFDSDMWICPAKPSSKRRYEYIEYENGRVLGHKKACTRGTTKVDSWWRYLFWHCSYCFCVCDEQGYDSDRYFSLREVVSNTTENKIVTGLRFRKQNRIMFLQIQEGTLLPNGQVNATTVKWKELDEFKITDRNVRNGVDYHTMEWNKRAIDLNKVTGKVGEVVTGVRFRLVGSHLNLEAQMTGFNFETGKLIEPETLSVWTSNYHTQSQNTLTEIKMNNPDVPTEKKVGKSVINKRDDVYIEFTHSGIDADVAQTTIPYLDAQDVVPVPPMPLIGVGLYHKAAPGSGGFVGPRIYTYDMTAHIEVPNTNH